jgi:hypothetical protein
MANKARRLSGINTLAYMGIDPITAPYLVVEQRIPTQNDLVGMQIGAIWILEENFENNVPPRIFFLCGLNRNIADWIEILTAGAGVAEEFVTDNGDVFPAVGVINVNGGISTGGAATNINTYANPANSNNLVVALNNSISQPNTSADGTKGLYSLGGQPFLYNYGTRNTFVGSNAGNLTLTTASATDNTFVGSFAGNAVTTGNQNTFVGSSAGSLVTSSAGNTALGFQALSVDTNVAGANVAVGWNAFGAVTAASSSVAIGYNAANANNNANNDVCIGFRAMQNAATAVGVSGNTVVGAQALQNVTSFGNTAVGKGSLQALTSGTGTAVGINALQSETTGPHNIAIGNGAGQAQNGASNNLYIGDAAGANNQSSTVMAIGYNALNAAANLSTSIAIGNAAAQNSGPLLAALIIGHGTAGTINNGNVGTTNNNIFIGHDSLQAAGLVGGQDIVIGNFAGNSMTTATQTTCVSHLGFGALTTGVHNTGIGHQVASALVTGSNNCFMGYIAGENYTGAESNNICIGASVTGTVGESNTTRIGVQGTQTKCVIAGIRGVTTGNADAIAVLVDSAGQLGTISSSRRYKENIDDMDDASDALYKLRPVVFNYKSDETKRMQYGLIAEEVEEAMPRLVVYNEDGLPETVKYHDLPVLLLNEIQLLNARITDLEDARISRRSPCKECSISIQ